MRLGSLLTVFLLLASPAAAEEGSPRRVACVGDSITFGSGIKDRETMAYPAQLGRLLGENWEVRNFGVSGATMLNEGDKPYQKQAAFQQALAFKPDVVVIKLGTNDTKPHNWKLKENFAADAKSLLAAFRKANPEVKLYLCLPIPAFPGNFGITEEVIAGGAIPELRRVAEEEKIPLIDLHTLLADRAELVPDKVHPNAEGATLMAEAVEAAITQP